jgi:hypothetical protein
LPTHLSTSLVSRVTGSSLFAAFADMFFSFVCDDAV